MVYLGRIWSSLKITSSTAKSIVDSLTSFNLESIPMKCAKRCLPSIVLSSLTIVEEPVEKVSNFSCDTNSWCKKSKDDKGSKEDIG